MLIEHDIITEQTYLCMALLSRKAENLRMLTGGS